MAVLANNIANASTTAFKAERLMFAEYVGKTTQGVTLSFVQDVAVIRDTSEGAFVNTGNTLDLSINGDGYFSVDTNDGIQYTRNGRLRLDEEGRIVTSTGHAILDEDGREIVLTGNEVTIDITPDGTVSTENGVIGQVGLVRFANEQALRPTESGMFETDQAHEVATEARVVQGMLEESNVEPIIEMTKMIDAMRGYQGTQRIVETEHERQRTAIQALTETV
jgi:flagellar basal-body rod protein FlgF